MSILTEVDILEGSKTVLFTVNAAGEEQLHIGPEYLKRLTDSKEPVEITFGYGEYTIINLPARTVLRDALRYEENIKRLRTVQEEFDNFYDRLFELLDDMQTSLHNMIEDR